jgi:hypothetical protein
MRSTVRIFLRMRRKCAEACAVQSEAFCACAESALRHAQYSLKVLPVIWYSVKKRKKEKLIRRSEKNSDRSDNTMMLLVFFQLLNKLCSVIY